MVKRLLSMMLALFTLLGFAQSLTTPVYAAATPWQDSYAAVLKSPQGFYKINGSNDSAKYNRLKSQFYFSLRDLDGNGIPELIVRWDMGMAGHPETIYTYSEGILDLGYVGISHEFTISDNPKYPGLFHGYGYNGFESGSYVTIKNNKIIEEVIFETDGERISINNVPFVTELRKEKPIPTYSITDENINKIIYGYKNPANDKTPSLNVKSTSSKVFVDGKLITFEAYIINGNNYFKLRDLANVVKGTEKRFEVTWNSKTNTINLVSNKDYTVVGGELATGDGKDKAASVNKSPIYKDGVLMDLMAYTINGNNYFKLRDLAQAFNIGVFWDSITKTISIDTSVGYTAE